MQREKMRAVMEAWLAKPGPRRISRRNIEKALGVSGAEDRRRLKGVVRDLVREGKLRTTDKKGVYVRGVRRVRGRLARRKGRLRVDTESGSFPVKEGRGPAALPGDLVAASVGKDGRASLRKVEEPGTYEVEGFAYGSSFFPERDFGGIRFRVAEGEGPSGRQARLRLTPETRRGDDGSTLAGELVSAADGGGFPSELAMPALREEGVRLGFRGKPEARRLDAGPARRDITGWKVFTIDGDDSKDFDDAVSVRRDGDGFVLGVHIADVSAWVPEGSKTDREAWRRGTSVYAGGGVVPMLPWELCDDLCSLVEGEDRPALSCVMRIGPDGKVRESEIFESTIRSSRRMRYSEVNRLFGGHRVPELEGFEDELEALRELSEVLVERRRRPRGAVLFEMPEERFVFGEGGVPVRVESYMRGDAEKLIEEMMLVANETVAEWCRERDLPILYRVHDAPAPEDVEELRGFLSQKGLSLPGDGDDGKAYQALIAASEDREDSLMVRRRMLRAFAAACYSEKCSPHFGLGSGCYCHFTSPIRRYPDLLVHRAVKAALRGARPRALPEGAGERLSEAERNAVHAERTVSDVMKAWIMLPEKGKEFDGEVVSVHSFGAFVEVPSGAEGLVPVRMIKGGWLDFDEAAGALRSASRSVAPGDILRVRLTEVDTDSGKLTFKEV